MAQKLKIDCRMLVVDDGSTDRTAAIVEDKIKHDRNLQCVKHPTNRGPGEAFLTGFRRILEDADGNDVIISMDADNTHSEQTIRLMLARIQEGFELVIASVYAPGGRFIGVPFLRYVLSTGCNLIYRILFPMTGIREYTGFYRAYLVSGLRRTLARFAEINEPLISVPGFACAAEILIKARRMPLFMVEVPMLVRYDKKGGKSKLRIWRTIGEHLGIIGANLTKRHVV
jgi:dolichol-phosphate mannosyltransferase